jgi:hypothetical protein
MLMPTKMAQSEALKALSHIRAVVDRTTRYSTFSALSGFIAGLAALGGSGVCGLWPACPGARPETKIRFLTVWALVCAVGTVSMLLLTWLKARKRGEPAWTPIARTALSVLLGPGFAGVLGTVALSCTGHYELLPGLWLTLYGCGLYGLSFFAPLFLRLLGFVFIGFGLAAWMGWGAAALWLGLGFGGLHLVFGVIVLTRYRG